MHTVHASIQATHPQAPLGSGEAILIGLAALAITILLWAPVDHFNTMSHEGAHALFAILLGFTVIEVALDHKANGATRLAGKGLSFLIVGLVGYLGPSLFGLGGAKLIALGYPVAVLWLTVLLLVLLLTMVSRSFGLLSVPVAIVVLLVLAHYGGSGVEVVLSYGLTWLLLLSGVRVAFAHGSGAEDAKILRKHTHLPHGLWAMIWQLGSLAALFYGGDLIVLR